MAINQGCFFPASHCCCSIPRTNFLINLRILSALHASHHYNSYVLFYILLQKLCLMRVQLLPFPLSQMYKYKAVQAYIKYIIHTVVL
mgnify:CR=1 FL=1